MVVFPENTHVSIKPGFIEDQQCRVTLRLFDAVPAVNDLLSLYRNRIIEIETDCETLSKNNDYSFFADHNVRIRVTEHDVPFIQRTIKQLKTRRIIFDVKPEKNIKRLINLLCELKIPFHLDAGAVVEDNDVLAGVIDYFLYSSLLSSPIAPFDVLIQNEIQGRGFTLWHTECEKVGRHFYVSDEGLIYLSERYTGGNTVLGSVNDTWESIIDSDRYGKLKDFKNSLFRNDAECVYCPYYNMCEGFVKAVDNDRSCEAWKQAFLKIKNEVKKVKSLVEKEYGKDQSR